MGIFHSKVIFGIILGETCQINLALLLNCYANASSDIWRSGDFLWRGGNNDWAVRLHDGNSPFSTSAEERVAS